MRCFKSWLPALFVFLMATGCSSSMIKAKGRILKGGSPYQPEAGEGLRIILVPMESNQKSFDSYAAVYFPDKGRFEVQGKDGRGLPPGKYRVIIQLMKNKEDLFNNRLVSKSPFTCEVPPESGEIVVDLDQVEGLVKAPPPAKTKKPKAARG
jgi:hypothetical protein